MENYIVNGICNQIMRGLSQAPELTDHIERIFEMAKADHTELEKVYQDSPHYKGKLAVDDAIDQLKKDGYASLLGVFELGRLMTLTDFGVKFIRMGGYPTFKSKVTKGG